MKGKNNPTFPCQNQFSLLNCEFVFTDTEEFGSKGGSDVCWEKRGSVVSCDRQKCHQCRSCEWPRRFDNTEESYLFFGANVCGLLSFCWLVGT